MRFLKGIFTCEVTFTKDTPKSRAKVSAQWRIIKPPPPPPVAC